MDRKELKKLSMAEIEARIKKLDEDLTKQNDPAKLQDITNELQKLYAEKQIRPLEEEFARLNERKKALVEKKDKTAEEKSEFKQIGTRMKKLQARIHRAEERLGANKKDDKSKSNSNPENKKPQNQSNNKKNGSNSKPNSGNQGKNKDKKSQDENKDKKVIVDTKEIARLKEELKKTAEKRRIYKEEGSYELEAIEASKYSKLVEKIGELEELNRLPKIREEIAKLQEELKECAEKRRIYKNEGSYELESIEASKYSKLVEKISQLEKPIKAYEKRQEIARLKEELKKCAEKRKIYKDEGSYELEAIEASKYSEIVAKIDELENGKREQRSTPQPGQNPNPNPNSGLKPDPIPVSTSESKDLEPHHVKTSETAPIEQDAHTSYYIPVPIEPKEGRLKKMDKGLFGAIGRKLAQIWKAIKNGPIGKPFKWVANRYLNKAGNFKKLPWEDRILRRFGLDNLENDIEEEIIDEATTNVLAQNEGTNNSKNEEQKNNATKTKQRSVDNLDREGIHKTVSSLIDALNSVQSSESEYEEETAAEEAVVSGAVQTMENEGDPGKTSNTRREEGVDGAKFTSEVISEEKEDNKSDLMKTKKKVKKGMESETITFGGYKFSGMDKITISKFMNGKKFIKPQLVITTEGEELWINPGSKELETVKRSAFDETLRDEEAAKKVIEMAEEYHDDEVKRGEPIITVNQNHSANRGEGR